MERKLLQTAQQAVLAATHRLDSEERISAFLAQSRMMVALYRACQRPRPHSRRR